jgi:hypothetical protein
MLRGWNTPIKGKRARWKREKDERGREMRAEELPYEHPNIRAYKNHMQQLCSNLHSFLNQLYAILT